MGGSSQADRGIDRIELIAVVLLSITAILTAWCGFQSSKWGGAMSISFAQASTARIEAARFESTANRRITVQVGLFTQWLQAHQDGDDELADFLEQRFPEPLATAFPDWLAARPLANDEAPATPFDMPAYVLPEAQEAADADARADARYTQALANNQRGDNYTVLTVLYATVLFFAAIAGRMRTPRVQRTLLALALAGFAVATTILLTFPRLV